QQLQQVFTGYTLFTEGNVKHFRKLSFQHTIDVFRFLLFHQLDAVFRLLLSSTSTVLTGRVVFLLKCFAVSFDWFPELTGNFCFWTCISSHCNLSLNYTLLRFGGRHPL